ncbi:MAG: KTSC domain-containing protein [Spartobacteria bacterium]
MKSKWITAFTAILLLTAKEAPAEADSDDAIISHVPRTRVESSGLASIGYSKRRHVLEIEFSNGAVYRYVDVAPSVYRDLMSAESKARYYDLNIKRNYRSVRVRPRVKDQPDN